MVWARLDDAILDNPKIAKAGVIGFAMHVAAITWCCRNLTDGFVPYSRVRGLLDLTELDIEYLAATGGPEAAHDSFLDAVHNVGRAEPDRVAQRLVDVALWHEDKAKGGYWLNDFLEYNPSREETEALRASKAEAGKRGAEKRWGTQPRESGVVPKNTRAAASSMAPAIADPLAGRLADRQHVEVFGRNAAASASPTALKSRATDSAESTNAVGKASAKAPAMAPAMGSPMANGWQNDAPVPDPVPERDHPLPTPLGSGAQPRPVAPTREVGGRVLGPDGDSGTAFGAWQDGIRKVTGGPVAALSASERRDVVDLVNGHAEGRQGEALMAWISETAAAWGKQHDARYGGFKPAHCKTWLDAGRPARVKRVGNGGPVQSSENRSWTPPKDMP